MNLYLQVYIYIAVNIRSVNAITKKKFFVFFSNTITAEIFVLLIMNQNLEYQERKNS